jgi:hypothetical protein
MISVLLSLFYGTVILPGLPVNGDTIKVNDSAYKIEWLYKKEVEKPESQFLIDISQYTIQNTFLELQSDQNFYLFNSTNLIGSSKNKSIDLSLDSLRKMLVSDTLIVFTKGEASRLKIGFYQKSQVNEYPSFTDSIKAQSKPVSGKYQNLLILLVMLFLVLLTTLKVSFPKKFHDVFSLSRIFSTRPVEGDNLRLRLFEQDGLLATVLYTFAIAIIIYLYAGQESITFLNNDSADLRTFFQSWLISIVLLIIKIGLIFFLSALYKTSRINTFYIKELINISAFFITLFLTITMLLYFYGGSLPYFWGVLAKNALIIMYLIRTGLIFFKILKMSGFTYLYLFSYFCATEIFPFVIGLKYFY